MAQLTRVAYGVGLGETILQICRMVGPPVSADLHIRPWPAARPAPRTSGICGAGRTRTRGGNGAPGITLCAGPAPKTARRDPAPRYRYPISDRVGLTATRAARRGCGSVRHRTGPTCSVTFRVVGYVPWLLCFGAYVWPKLRSMDRVEGQRAIATLHSFRFFGLFFIIPGVVGPNLPTSFATFAAYGDFATGLLAMLLSTRL